MDKRTWESEHQVIENSYSRCVVAMQYMWINDIVTDSEYNEIMRKLNQYYNKAVKEHGVENEVRRGHENYLKGAK